VHFLDTTDTANYPIWMWALASTAHTSFISSILVSFTDLNDLAGYLCSCPGNPGFRVHLQQKGGVPPCVGLPSPRRNCQEEVSDCALVKPHHCFLAHSLQLLWLFCLYTFSCAQCLGWDECSQHSTFGRPVPELTLTISKLLTLCLLSSQALDIIVRRSVRL
jgi:hypothetical protein